MLPQFNFPQISVITHQPGATAVELESLIARPLEGRILALPNLVSVRSTMGHGTVQTDIRFARGTDPQQDLQAVNSAIDRARGAGHWEGIQLGIGDIAGPDITGTLTTIAVFVPLPNYG